MAWAIKLSQAMPRKELATLAMKTTADSAAIPDLFAGKKPIAAMPAEVNRPEIQYHFLWSSVTSTIGAQKNFQVCGRITSALSAVICATGTPACLSW